MPVLLGKEDKSMMLIRLKVNMLAEVDGRLTQCGPDTVLNVKREFGNQCVNYQQADPVQGKVSPEVKPLQRVSMLPPIDAASGERFPSWDAYEKHAAKMAEEAKKAGR